MFVACTSVSFIYTSSDLVNSYIGKVGLGVGDFS